MGGGRGEGRRDERSVGVADLAVLELGVEEAVLHAEEERF